ncbi:MAG: FmdB family zinc ribbon protein [Alkalispirochaeta sp.]
MPTYDYQCDQCGHAFETMQSMKDAPLSVCPQCEQATLRRIISGGTGVIFKGSGFYVNDSRTAGSGASGGTAKSKDSQGGSASTASGSKERGSQGDTAKADSSKKSA